MSALGKRKRGAATDDKPKNVMIKVPAIGTDGTVEDDQTIVVKPTDAPERADFRSPNGGR
jgi:hypothetical protein